MSSRGLDVADDTLHRIGGNVVERTEEDVDALILDRAAGKMEVEAIDGESGGLDQVEVVLARFVPVRTTDYPWEYLTEGLDLSSLSLLTTVDVFPRFGRYNM